MIYFTSDLHFGHDKEFVWGARGFKSLKEMEDTIVERWNKVVTDEDTVYILGDVYMGDDEDNRAVHLLNELNGQIRIIIGNHDTERKINKLKAWGYEFDYSGLLTHKIEGKKRKWQFFLSHYPTYTANLESNPYDCVINLHGHTHNKGKFFEDRPYMYNVSLDAHDCVPVSIEEVIKDFKAEVNNCINCI